MAEPVYGAFGNILNLEEEENKGVDPIIYNIYQQQQQTYDKPSSLQATYGTGVNPIFEWVKTIQTGQRSYNPQDSFDESALKEYEELYNTGQVPQGFMTPEEITQQVLLDTAGVVAGQAGGQIGAALIDPNLPDKLGTTGRILEGVKATFGSTPTQYYQQIKDEVFGNNEIVTALNKDGLTIVPELKDLDAAKQFGNEELFLQLQKDKALTNVGTDKTGEVFALKDAKATDIQQNNPKTIKLEEFIQAGDVAAGQTTVVDRLNWNTPVGASNWANAAGTAGVSFITSLAMGEKPLKAAKRATGTAIGKAIGTAVAPVLGPLAPIAPIIGSILGSVIGGRVICNELMRQGIMTRKQVVLDYKFTRDYLTPQHIVGYHAWSIYVVKQMRKGKFVKFWKHVAGHRANEIAYIYGERNKPDYLGKLYRLILEPSCWLIGAFSVKKDWSILYKNKEII